jgi:hypothetical protein
MSFFLSQLGRVLTLTLIAAWLGMTACAAVQQTPATHRPMPCCPPQAGTRGCSASQCEQAPEITEVQSGGHLAALPVAKAAFSDWAVAPRTEAESELTPGLRFAAAVFRLKDDLRI